MANNLNTSGFISEVLLSPPRKMVGESVEPNSVLSTDVAVTRSVAKSRRLSLLEPPTFPYDRNPATCAIKHRFGYLQLVTRPKKVVYSPNIAYAYATKPLKLKRSGSAPGSKLTFQRSTGQQVKGPIADKVNGEMGDNDLGGLTAQSVELPTRQDVETVGDGARTNVNVELITRVKLAFQVLKDEAAEEMNLDKRVQLLKDIDNLEDGFRGSPAPSTSVVPTRNPLHPSSLN